MSNKVQKAAISLCAGHISQRGHQLRCHVGNLQFGRHPPTDSVGGLCHRMPAKMLGKNHSYYDFQPSGRTQGSDCSWLYLLCAGQKYFRAMSKTVWTYQNHQSPKPCSRCNILCDQIALRFCPSRLSAQPNSVWTSPNTRTRNAIFQ